MSARKSIDKRKYGDSQRTAKVSEGFVSFFSTTANVDNKDDGGFIEESFMDIFVDVQSKIPGAQLKITKTMKLVIEVQSRQLHEVVKSWKKIGGIDVERHEEGNTPLWGRIEGVHPQLNEQALGKLLADQGVIKVRRIQYSVTLHGSTGTKIEKRNSDKVDLQFEGTIKGEVNLVGTKYEVTLQAPHPRQCTKCLRFNHKKEQCSVSAAALCARCGESGHLQATCKKVPRCINCHLQHSAMSTSCAIYKTWANEAAGRYVAKVQRTTNSAVVTKTSQESSIPQSQSVSSSSTAVCSTSSYASVTKKSLVNENNEVICHVREEKKIQIGRKLPVKATQETKKNRETDERKLKDDETKKKLNRLWAVLTEFLESYGEKYPEMKLLVKVMKEIESILLDL